MRDRWQESSILNRLCAIVCFRSFQFWKMCVSWLADTRKSLDHCVFSRGGCHRWRGNGGVLRDRWQESSIFDQQCAICRFLSIQFCKRTCSLTRIHYEFPGQLPAFSFFFVFVRGLPEVEGECESLEGSMAGTFDFLSAMSIFSQILQKCVYPGSKTLANPGTMAQIFGDNRWRGNGVNGSERFEGSNPRIPESSNP